MSDNRILAGTLEAIRIRSWQAVLLRLRMKKPQGEHWRVTTDPEEITRHVQAGGNIGLLCGESTGVAVLDQDNTTMWAEMEAELGKLSKAWVETGSGKKHYYVKWEPDLPAKLIWRGEKVGEIQRGPGQQQVVLPPSVHPNGTRYRWLVNPASELLLPLPGGWRAYLRGRSSTGKTRRDIDALTEAALRQPGAVRRTSGMIKFQCPACAADGHDRHQDNAVFFPDTGNWGCAWAKDTGVASAHWEAIERVLGGLSRDPLYEATPAGLFLLKQTGDGVVRVRLTNFTARILADFIEDDGAEERHAFEIEASLNRRCARSRVSASQFSSMSWPAELLGAMAVVYPGMGIKDHARAAVQLLSHDVPQRRVYTHLGWRKLDTGWVYLHAGGAIGPDGGVSRIDVRLLDELASFELPNPPAGGGLVTAIRASLALLDVAPDAVTVPILAAVYRAVLRSADFSIHMTGRTDLGKTALAALAQQHFGAGLHDRNLPGSWLSTGNALESLAFVAKDALLVVDDFTPAGSHIDIQRHHREADRLLRAQGNSAGRQRMRPDTTLKPRKPPRGLILSTGEDVPHGQSLRARLFVLELSPGAVDWERLTRCQGDAATGLYAQALAGFIRWLAARYEDLRTHLSAEVAELRQVAFRSGQHRRTAHIVAHLAVGVRLFSAFTQDAGALTREEADRLRSRCWTALGEVVEIQGDYQAVSEPTRRFRELLGAAVASGQAHVAGPEGSEPKNPQAWGWRSVTVGTGENQRDEWRPQGERVGWVNDTDLFLEPEAAYLSVQNLVRGSGEVIGVMSKTLHKRLSEQGLLASTEPARRTLTVRRNLEGKRRTVLHLHASFLMQQETDQPAQFELG